MSKNREINDEYDTKTSMHYDTNEHNERTGYDDKNNDDVVDVDIVVDRVDVDDNDEKADDEQFAVELLVWNNKLVSPNNWGQIDLNDNDG